MSKFPLPISPKTWRTPRSTKSRPTASETLNEFDSSAGDQGKDAGRTAGAADDRQRARDQHRARHRQPVEVRQLGETVLARPEHEGVARKWRVEAVGRAGVGPDRLH